MITDPSSTRALVQTIDVVTPMVDDPRTFGAIAAANSISDVYAMAGDPRVALSFIGFPSDVLPLSVLGEIAEGLRSKAAEAGAAIIGGHTIIDPEPKAGLAVTGEVERDRAWSHRRGVAGQALILSKPLGTGVAINALKRGDCPEPLATLVVASMLRLNRAAKDAGLAAGATSATDVTGFGLLLHLGNICSASGLGAELSARHVPVLPGVVQLVRAGRVPGGSKRNLSQAAEFTRFDADVPDEVRLVLADAQTSGGLLLCVPEPRADELLVRLRDEGHDAARIGSLRQGAGVHVVA